MRASVFIATSLDGFIARADGTLDWLPAEPEPHGYDEFIASIDGIVIGRKTYEWVQGYVASRGGWPYGNMRVFVLSSTLTELHAPQDAVCERLSGEPQEIVEQLSARGLRHIYVDGGVTIQRFLRAGLIDSMTITHIPVLLGSGIPLFGPLEQDMHWTHVTTRTYPSGMVQSEYARA